MRHDLENAPALLDDIAHIARDVRDTLGAGYPARAYLDALRHAVSKRLPARRVEKLTTTFDGHSIEFRSGSTLLVAGVVAVHAIVADKTHPHHRAALRRRLEALDVTAGVLLNFADSEVADGNSFIVREVDTD